MDDTTRKKHQSSAIKFLKLIEDRKLYELLGVKGAALLEKVAIRQDRTRGRHADFKTCDLMKRLGVRCRKRFYALCRRVAASEWLDYYPAPQGSKRPARFRVRIPDHVRAEMAEDILLGHWSDQEPERAFHSCGTRPHEDGSSCGTRPHEDGSSCGTRPHEDGSPQVLSSSPAKDIPQNTPTEQRVVIVPSDEKKNQSTDPPPERRWQVGEVLRIFGDARRAFYDDEYQPDDRDVAAARAIVAKPGFKLDRFEAVAKRYLAVDPYAEPFFRGQRLEKLDRCWSQFCDERRKQPAASANAVASLDALIDAPSAPSIFPYRRNPLPETSQETCHEREPVG